MPRTCIGWYNWASACCGDDMRTAAKYVNGGSGKGYNAQELAVGAATCHLMLRRALGEAPAESAIAQWAERVKLRLTKVAATVPELAALMSATLNDWATSQMVPRPLPLFTTQMSVVNYSARNPTLGHGDGAVLVAAAEQMAFGAGFDVPLAPRGHPLAIAYAVETAVTRPRS